MNFLRNTQINFLKYRRFWVVASFVVMAVGLVAIFRHGKLNVGIDFSGGTQLTVGFEHPPSVDQLRKTLADAGFDAQIQAFGEGGDEFLIRLPAHAESEALEEAGKGVVDALAPLGTATVLGKESVGPQIGAELRQKAILAVALSLLGMLAYIWLRFELRFGIGAIAASIHDVLVTLGLFALVGLEFNLTTIAAFLTLIGYSVNDTVVLFDRVRENLRKGRRDSLETVMNRSINETLSRTVLTSGTTLLAAISLLVFGGDVLRGFSFILTVGVIVGTYSSIYIASPFALLWESWLPGKGRRSGPTAAPPGNTPPATPGLRPRRVRG